MENSQVGLALKELKIDITSKEINEFLFNLGNPSEIDFAIFLRLAAIKFKEIEFIKELECAFKSFDNKNKGYLTYDELKIILTENGPCLSLDQSEELLKSLNIKGDFDYADFVKKSI